VELSDFSKEKSEKQKLEDQEILTPKVDLKFE